MTLAIQQIAHRVAYSLLERDKAQKLFAAVEPTGQSAPSKAIKASQSALAELGFSWLISFRYLNSYIPNSSISAIHSSVSPDRTIVADVSQAGWSVTGFLNVFLTRLLNFNWQLAYLTLKVGTRKQTYVDVESELADGRFLRTTNRPDASYSPKSEKVAERFLPYATPIAKLVSIHKARLKAENDSGVPACEITSGEERMAMQERINDEQLLTAINADWTKDANPAKTGLTAEGSRLLFAEINKLLAPHRTQDVLAPTTQDKPAPRPHASENQSGGNFGGSVVSALAFLAVAAAFFSVKTALILLVVVAIHEGGHYLAMLASGYRDVKIFFVPGLGGVTIGQPTAVSLWRRIFVLMAGPVPGVILGFVIYRLQVLGLIDVDWAPELAFTFIIVNLFNLLPIVPLDGGQIVEALLSARWIYARFALVILSLLPLLLMAWMLRSVVLLMLLVFALASLPRHFRTARLLAAYRKRYGTDAVDSETAFGRLFEIQQTNAALGVASNTALEAANKAVPMLLVKPASWFTSFAGLILYTMVLLGLPIAGAILVLHRQHEPNTAQVHGAKDSATVALNPEEEWRKQKQAMVNDAKTDEDKWSIYMYDAEEDHDAESARQAWNIAKNWPAGDERRISTLLVSVNARNADRTPAGSPQQDLALLQQAREEIAASNSIGHEKKLSLMLDLYLGDKVSDKPHAKTDLANAFGLIQDNESGMYQAEIRRSMAIQRYAAGKPDEAVTILMQSYEAGIQSNSATQNKELQDELAIRAARDICLIHIAQGHPDAAMLMASKALDRIPRETSLTSSLIELQAHAATMRSDFLAAQKALDQLPLKDEAKEDQRPRLVKIISWLRGNDSTRSDTKISPDLLLQQLDIYQRSHDKRAGDIAAQIRNLKGRNDYLLERYCDGQGERPIEIEEGEAFWSSVYDKRLLESLKTAGLCPGQ